MLPDWEQAFPGCEPLAHELRTRFRHRWVRFHSLPGSKRYPENEAEYTTVLDRHNRVMAELTQPSNPVVLLSTGYSDSTAPVRDEVHWNGVDADGGPWRTVVYDRHEPFYWHVFASERKWCPGAFDKIVRLIADEAMADVMIVAPDCRWLLHPYDGGMDVILDSRERRNQLKRLFAGWLSARRDGL